MRSIFDRSWGVCLLFMLAVATRPAEAQLSEMDFRTHAGVAMPLGSFGDFFALGPSIGVDAAYPLRDRLDLVLDLGWDFVNHHPGTYARNFQIWSFQLGMEGDLLGDPAATLRLRPFVSGGLKNFKTEERAAGTAGEVSSINLAGTAGLRLGLATGEGITWWLSGELAWSPVAEEDAETVLSAARVTNLSPYSSATNAAVTLGFSLPF